MKNREIYSKDPSNRKLVNEGVASVNDETTEQALSVLRYELDTFVCDGQYAKGMEDILETLPWVATIDKFQHWIYEHPDHTTEQRKNHWNRIFHEFADTVTDWRGLEEAQDYLWQKQLHLYEVPFYYIEYGMAQLGAIAIWRNFKLDNRDGLEGYLNALRLGNLRTIPEIYKAAGIKFDFSKPYIRELMSFVREEMGNV